MLCFLSYEEEYSACLNEWDIWVLVTPGGEIYYGVVENLKYNSNVSKRQLTHWQKTKATL